MVQHWQRFPPFALFQYVKYNDNPADIYDATRLGGCHFARDNRCREIDSATIDSPFGSTQITTRMAENSATRLPRPNPHGSSPGNCQANSPGGGPREMYFPGNCTGRGISLEIGRPGLRQLPLDVSARRRLYGGPRC